MGLFRKTRTYWVDAEGKRANALARGARKVKVQSKVWTGRYRDENGLLIEVPLCRNKAAAETMLSDLRRKVELGKAGLRNPFEEHQARPLAEWSSERVERERSDFLLYRSAAGQADFHALRHTFLSRLGRSGAHPRVMMALARHTTVELTLNRYTHVSVADLAGAVGKLPALPILPEPRDRTDCS